MLDKSAEFFGSSEVQTQGCWVRSDCYLFAMSPQEVTFFRPTVPHETKEVQNTSSRAFVNALIIAMGRNGLFDTPYFYGGLWMA